MPLEAIRQFCRALPGVTEDVKWGSDLCFCIGGKMFCVVNLEPPHQMSFKCTPEEFAGLVERDGIIPAPYLARAMWVQERSAGDVLDRAERERLLRTSYDLIRAKLPRRLREASASQGRLQCKPIKTPAAAPSRRARPSRRGRGASRRRRR